jgi:hypothetical protein
VKIQCPYRCDYCQTVKGETNHWWMRPVETEQFTLLRWDNTLANTEGYEHICSESCAAKALSKWMTHGSPQIASRPAPVSPEVRLRTQ